MPELTPAERRSLKARAHKLKPVVLTGEAGLSAAVVAEIDRQLASHGLIKVRLAAGDRRERATSAAALGAALGASLVQQIGRMLVLYRPKPQAPPAAPGKNPRRVPRARRAPSRSGRLPGKGKTPQT
ncbi:YhbY family RNA-binding protein [Pelomicrobium sp. G1]|uniref:YhbY family RNA-binding protein n=1 Tax=unclassified Pelomicrobium TaxID=2815318 RepID=UPI003F76A1AE